MQSSTTARMVRTTASVRRLDKFKMDLASIQLPYLVPTRAHLSMTEPSLALALALLKSSTPLRDRVLLKPAFLRSRTSSQAL